MTLLLDKPEECGSMDCIGGEPTATMYHPTEVVGTDQLAPGSSYSYRQNTQAWGASGGRIWRWSPDNHLTYLRIYFRMSGYTPTQSSGIEIGASTQLGGTRLSPPYADRHYFRLEAGSVNGTHEILPDTWYRLDITISSTHYTLCIDGEVDIDVEIPAQYPWFAWLALQMGAAANWGQQYYFWYDQFQASDAPLPAPYTAWFACKFTAS